MMESEFDDELRQLKNALRQETFRFILVGHNRFSIYQDISAWLRITFPKRHFIELRLANKDYRQINDELMTLQKGIVLIPDFGWLFRKENEAICVAFNQRRDAFARLDIALICFIEPSQFIEVPKKVPDWWSLRSLELDFHREEMDVSGEFSPTKSEISSLGGQTKEEKEVEIQRLLRQIEEVDPLNKELLQELYFQIGDICFDLSFFEESQKYFEKSLIICREINNYEALGRTLNSLSQIAKIRGNYDLALAYLNQSLQIRKLIGDKLGESQTLNNISSIYLNRGSTQIALSYLEDSLKITRQINEKLGEGVILNNIGQIYKEQGNYEESKYYLEQSLLIRRQINDRNGESSTLLNLGGIELAKGNFQLAENYFLQSLIISKEIGNLITEGSILNNLGHIYKMQSNYETAINYLGQSLTIREQTGDRLGIAMTSTNLGDLYYTYLKKIDKAIPLFLQAYMIFKEIGSPRFETPLNYLNKIREEIGEERFNQIVQSTQSELSS